MKKTTITVIEDALVAAIIGYIVIAAVFGVADVYGRRTLFYTPGVLGHALFDDTVTSPVLTPRLVFGYTAVHLAVLLIFGLIAALLARVAERGPQLWYVGLFLLIFVGFHLFAAVQTLSAPAVATISQPTIWVAGLLAGALMALYLLRAHPLIRRRQSWQA